MLLFCVFNVTSLATPRRTLVLCIHPSHFETRPSALCFRVVHASVRAYVHSLASLPPDSRYVNYFVSCLIRFAVLTVVINPTGMLQYKINHWLGHWIDWLNWLIDWLNKPVKIHSVTYLLNRFGSWTYNGYQLDLVKRSDVDLTSYDTNCYRVVDSWTSRNILIYECCPEPYVDIEITLHLLPNESTFE